MDAYDHAAAEMAAALERETPEVQQAYRYLFARVALDAGLTELVGHEIRPNGERLVCREIASGKFYAVDRPGERTPEEEMEYVAAMRARLLEELAPRERIRAQVQAHGRRRGRREAKRR